jgi:hypothetical protein
MNLYGFLENEAANRVDYLGLTIIEVDSCEAYLFIGHGSHTKPIIWKLNGACSLAGAVTCFPDVNQPRDIFEIYRGKEGYPLDNLWPNVPTHSAQTTLGGVATNTAAHNSMIDAEARDFPQGDPRSEHNIQKAVENALDSIGQAVMKLCLSECCCTSVKIIVETGNDKLTNSDIEKAVTNAGVSLDGKFIDDDNEVYSEVFRCPGK